MRAQMSQISGHVILLKLKWLKNKNISDITYNSINYRILVTVIDHESSQGQRLKFSKAQSFVLHLLPVMAGWV